MPAADLGPLTLSEILDRMFTIYRKKFLLLASVAALPYIFIVPFFALLFLAGAFPSISTTAQAPPDPKQIEGIMIFVFILFAGFMLCGFLAWLATTAAVWEIQMGREPTIRGAYGMAWRRIGTSLVAGVLGALAVFTGYVLLIIPAIFVGLALSLTGAVIIGEDEGAIDSLKRSWKLTSGYRWRIFVAMFICNAISTVICYIFILPPLFLTPFLVRGGSFPSWFIAVLGMAYFLGLVLPAPLLAIALCLIYYDARVRKEGFDLQRMMDTLPPPIQPSAGPVPEAG